MSLLGQSKSSLKDNNCGVAREKDEKIVKWLCTFCVVMAALVSLVWMRNVFLIKTTYSVSQFLPKNSPVLQLDMRIRKQFQLSTQPALIAILDLPQNETKTWLTSARMQRLKDATNRLQAFRGVNRVVSLANAEGAAQADGAITVGPLTELTPSRNWAETFLKNPLLTPTLISKDAKSVMVFIEPKPSDISTLSQTISRARTDLSKAFPEAHIEMGGTPAIQTGLSELLSSEMKNFVLLSVAACAALLFLVFRSFLSMTLPLVLTVFANVAVFSMMGWAGIPFTLLSATIPILVFITVVGICVHVMLRLAEEAGHDKTSTQSTLVIRTNRALVLPNFLGALTTCVGFLTLFTSPAPMIHDYGLVVAGAVMAAWMTTSLLIVPFGILFPIPTPREWVFCKARWSLWVMQHRREVVAITALGSVIMAVGGSRLSWSARLFDDLPYDNEARASTERLDQSLGGAIPFEIVIRAKEGGAWSDPGRLAALDSLLKEMRTTHGVGSALSLPDYLMATQPQMKKSRMPASREAAAETYFLYSLSPSDPLRHYLTADGKGARIEIRLRDIPADRQQILVRHLIARTSKIFAKDRVQIGGMGASIHKINNDVAKDLIFGFWQSLLIITAVLGLIFRSVRWALVAAIPNLVPPIVLFGYLGYSQTPVKPGIALIFSIALGLAFNNTVYLLNRIQSMIKDGRPSPVRRAFVSESNACLVATLVVLTGFSVFLFSYFSINRTFGLCMILSVIAGIVGDLILLPAMISLWPRLIFPKVVNKSLIGEQPVGARQNDLLGDELLVTEEKQILKSAASFILPFLIGASALNVNVDRAAAASSGSATVDPKAEAVLRHSFDQIKSQDEVSQIKMTIVEADGSKKDRTMEVKRMGNASTQRVMARLQAPPDLRGMAFLSIVEKGKENRWIYLPSTKQTRRVIGGKTEGGILGSELTYEDLNPSAVRNSGTHFVDSMKNNKGKSLDVIQMDFKPGTSQYKKAVLFLDHGQSLPLRLDYFSSGLKPVKSIHFSSYKKYGSVWRAQKISVVNFVNKRKTNIVLSDAKLNSGIKASEFSSEGLSDQ